tara:strand:+ start:144 stop:599 length:456 start_codon:yes stop_codon:yes gene_type:complete
MTFSSGEVLTAANLNALQDVTILTDTSVTIATGSGVVIPFPSEVIDVGGWHSTSTNTERITVTNAGVYLITANVVNIDALGRLLLNVTKNGSTLIASQDLSHSGSVNDDSSVAVHDLAAAGDYYTMSVYHSHGSDRTADRITFAASTIYVS